MDFKPVRRYGKTYGKSNKAVQVHDLFDFRLNRDNVDGPALAGTSSTPSSSIEPHHIEDEPLESKPSPNSNSIHSPPSQKSGPGKDRHGNLSEVPVDGAAFYDMRSSDEDLAAGESESHLHKRRRTTKPLRSLKSENTSQPSAAIPRHKTIPIGTGRPLRKSSAPAAEPKSARPVKSITSHKKTSLLSDDAKAPMLSSHPQRKPATTQTHLQLSKISDSRISVEVPRRDARIADQTVPDLPEYTSDQSHHSTPSDGVTPKRKRLTQMNTTSDISSPSQTGMTSLNLTAIPSPVKSSTELSSDESALIKKPRRRLIDRLDAPVKGAGHISDDHSSDAALHQPSVPPQRPAKSRQRLPKPQNKSSEDLGVASTPEPSQNRSTWAGKARTTYATQRSHLSDMVDQIDGLDVPASQKTAGELLAQAPSSSLASQLELEEDESDDHTGAGKLKSIHELRQSGANKRFDREIDTLLEDVDTTEQFSKALRLQALMKLIRRLTERSFLRQFVVSGRIQRLTSLTARSLDLTTSVLLGVVFYLVTKSEEITLDTLRLVLRSAVDLAPNLLDSNKSLTKIVKERKENLSKATANDLTNFENDIGAQGGIVPEHGHIYPDLVALHILEKALRKMIQLGDTSARFSTSTYTQLLHVVQVQARNLRVTNDPLTVAKVETALSLLELCSIMVDDANLHVSDNQYQVLGNALADIMDIRDDQQAIFEQNVLRVVVSLSNNKPAMCSLLGNTAITDQAFHIVNKHFLGLSIQADFEHGLDESKLNSVVLALGCLLNFAECDANLRVRLSRMSPGENNYIAQLVSLFNTQVSKVDEATTQEQSQVLVAFGYLSMLLCTLSLEPLIRQQITRLLRQKSFDDLCQAAETFFSHLRTLEAISEDDSSLGAFTARFSAILDTIRSTNK